MKSTIKLFKALPIKVNRKKNASIKLLEETIKRGFVFSPEVVYNYSEEELLSMVSLIEKEHGLTPEKTNATFHKSWKKVKEEPIEVLILEQLIHYFTTYGFEALGIESNMVFIPSEKLNIPELEKDQFCLVVIKGYKEEELKDKLLVLLNSGIALKEDTINNVIEVAEFVKISNDEVTKIKNKEVKIALYDKLNMIPKDPTEFLRYVIFKATDKTLLIKSGASIAQIKDTTLGRELFTKYKMEYGLDNLSTVFYRFKPLFLAFKNKEDKKINSIINRIRKLAVKNHKPMKKDYLNMVTGIIKNGHKIKKDVIEKELKKANTFRKIRLAYALNYRTKDVGSMLYRIRNGKGYATEFNFINKVEAKRVLTIVKDSIIKDLAKKVKGKKIFIPENIRYALPATEKQFTGNFPTGTYVSVSKDMVFGVHWNNVEYNRIDLDLSLLNADVGKIGWDGDYRSRDGDILFSGDITDAQGEKGASELFYVRKQKETAYLMNVNYYNHNEDVPVPYSIVIGQEQVRDLNQDYMLNPNNVVCLSKSVISRKQTVVGIIVTTTQGNRFYFVEVAVGNDITSSNNEHTKHTLSYLYEFYKNTINLNNMLVKAGAKMIEDKEKCDIDLSPEALEKDTILNLLI